MRARVVSIFSEALASSNVPVLDVATRYSELGEALLPLINPMVTGKYGVRFESFVVENVSLPPEVEQAIDKRSSMAAVGNLNDYVKFQMAQGLADRGSGGGAAGMATEMAVGMAMAQQMLQQAGGVLGASSSASASPQAVPALPELMTPEQVAQALGVSVTDVMSILENGELNSKKIGSAFRIKRADLQAYLEK